MFLFLLSLFATLSIKRGLNLSKKEKFCPILSAFGEELFLCDEACMFYDEGKCAIVEGLKSLSEMKNILIKLYEKVPI